MRRARPWRREGRRRRNARGVPRGQRRRHRGGRRGLSGCPCAATRRRLLAVGRLRVDADGGRRAATPITHRSDRSWYSESKAEAELVALAANDGALAVTAIRPHAIWDRATRSSSAASSSVPAPAVFRRRWRQGADRHDLRRQRCRRSRRCGGAADAGRPARRTARSSSRTASRSRSAPSWSRSARPPGSRLRPATSRSASRAAWLRWPSACGPGPGRATSRQHAFSRRPARPRALVRPAPVPRRDGLEAGGHDRRGHAPAGGVLPGRADAISVSAGPNRGGWTKAFPVSKPRAPPHEATTAIILIVISLAAVGAVAYGSYRERDRSNDLEGRIVNLEHTSDESASEIARLTADKVKLCRTVDIVRQKITGVVLSPEQPDAELRRSGRPVERTQRTIPTVNSTTGATPPARSLTSAPRRLDIFAPFHGSPSS